MTEKRTRKPPWVLIGFGVLASVPLLTELEQKFGDRVIVRPTNSAAAGASEALDPDDIAVPTRRDLPVWPPPSAQKPVDPASNPMSGALPMRVDWPGLPDAAAKFERHDAPR